MGEQSKQSPSQQQPPKKKTIKKSVKNKSVVREVIDLDQEEDNKPLEKTSADVFADQLHKQYHMFFGWVGSPDGPALAQHMWKVEMFDRASQMFPDLNNYELGKLLERDWNVMPQETRYKCRQEHGALPDADELERSLEDWEDKLRQE